MRAKTVALIAAAWVVAVGAGLTSVACSGTVHPSDDDMALFFQLHEAQFVEIRDMFENDRALEGIDVHTENAEYLPAGFDSARAADYRTRLRKLELESLERVNGMGGQPGGEQAWLYRSFSGITVSGSAKGYVYSSVPLAPVVKNTEDDAEGGSGITYHPLGNGWYVFYDWDR